MFFQSAMWYINAISICHVEGKYMSNRVDTVIGNTPLLALANILSDVDVKANILQKWKAPIRAAALKAVLPKP